MTMGDTAGQHQVSLREKKTGARQRFLRRSRALTLTISIPSLARDTTGITSRRSESVASLRRSHSTRDMGRHRHKLSASENCLDREDEVMSDIGPGCVSVINVCNNNTGNNNHTSNNTNNNGRTGFGYRLKRSLTVSHILDNLNKSFRVRRTSSQREMAAKKNKFRRYLAERVLVEECCDAV